MQAVVPLTGKIIEWAMKEPDGVKLHRDLFSAVLTAGIEDDDIIAPRD